MKDESIVWERKPLTFRSVSEGEYVEIFSLRPDGMYWDEEKVELEEGESVVCQGLFSLGGFA